MYACEYRYEYKCKHKAFCGEYACNYEYKYKHRMCEHELECE